MLVPAGDGSPAPATADSAPTIDEIVETLCIIGDPQRRAAQIAELHQTTALTDLDCVFGLGGAPDEIVRRSMMRFAEEVMPLLRSQPR